MECFEFQLPCSGSLLSGSPQNFLDRSAPISGGTHAASKVICDSSLKETFLLVPTEQRDELPLLTLPQSIKITKFGQKLDGLQ